MEITNLKTGSHGIILNIIDARKNYLTNPTNLRYIHGLSRQCCEYVASVWDTTNLLFIYPVSYLAKEFKNPDAIVEKWIDFLKDTPFPINYEGKITSKDIPPEVNVNLQQHLENRNHKFNGDKIPYIYDKKDFQEFYAFTINKTIVTNKYPKYALACFSMIRNLFIDNYRGYVQKCFDLKNANPTADNFHIIQFAFLDYKNVRQYCEGSYNLLYVEASEGYSGSWYWTLTNADTFIKNITAKAFVSINYCFDKTYVKLLHKNTPGNFCNNDVHSIALKKKIIDAIKKNDFQTAFNNVKKYEED